MAISVLTAPSADLLLAPLGRHLASRPADPLAKDVVVVPGRGMADWLQEHLPAHLGDAGIVANIDFWLPGAFARNVALGSSIVTSPWDVDHLAWAVLELLSTTSDPDTLAPGFSGARRRLQFATRIADLLDRYANQRPDMVLAWAAGHDTDGRHLLPPQHRWQPRLWRHLRQHLGESWPESLRSAGAQESQAPGPHDAGRLTLFGLDFLSRSTIDALARLGDRRQMAVFHVSPVDGLVAEFRSQALGIDTLRRDANLASTRRHPLLAAWSRSALESAALLGPLARDVATVSPPRGTSVLASLQASLSADEALEPGLPTASLWNSCDGSVQIHRCHGATRQVEVMRDAILHVFAADPSLRPRDVLVVCPDLDRFAPIVESVMGAALDARGRRLPVSIVDRSIATATPVAIAIDALLALASGRCAVPDMLAALSLEVVRRRLGLDDADLMLVTQWATELNVRWGIDQEHRSQWGYPSHLDDGTWRWAIERLSAGIIMQSTELGDDLPGLALFDDLSGADAHVVGRLFDFHRSLTALSQMIGDDRDLLTWADVLDFVLERFIAVDQAGRSHLLAAHDLVRHLREAAAQAPTATFGVADMRELVSQRLPASRGRGLSWADVVRVASPSRFRGLPSKVIAVLGFDDEAMRSGGRSADDILGLEPRLGERDPRADDRLGLLTLLHAAQRYLIITCDGHDVNDNSPVPVPVPLEELKDAIALAVARLPDDARGARPLVVDHSRQAADPVNVGLHSDSKDKNVRQFVDGPWTFDPSAPRVVSLTTAARSEAASDSGLATSALPPLAEHEVVRDISLTALAHAVKRPTEVWLRDRLGVTPPGDDGVADWEMPLWPSRLEFAVLARELLEARAAGMALDDWRRRRALGGGLPLMAAADALWASVEEDVESLVSAAGPLLDRPERLAEIRLALADRELERFGGGALVVDGTIPVRDAVRLHLNVARWHRRMRIDPWLEIAALTLDDPSVPWMARVVARTPKKDASAIGVVEEFRLRGSTAAQRTDAASRVLEFANEVRHRALRSAIPLFEQTSWMLTTSPATPRSTLNTELGFDLSRPATRLVFGDRDLGSFFAEPPWDGVDDDLPVAASRVEAYAAWLADTWNDTVEVVTAVEPAKGTTSRRASASSVAPDPEAP